MARFLGVRVWELARVAVHYQDEARVILQAQYKARLDLAKKLECSPEKIILSEF